MDDIDRAQLRDAQYQDDCQRERVYQAAKSSRPYTGQCHYCGAITGGGRRFCDTECRDGYDHEQRLLKINGRNR